MSHFRHYLVVVTLLTVSCTTYGYLGGNAYRPTRCHSNMTPCRLDITINSLEGEHIESSAAHTCSCQGSCSEDWTLTDRVVSRNLVSLTVNVTLRMMFCESIQPRENCSRGEIALVSSGYLDIPMELESYNCRCEHDVPLQLRRRSRENFQFYHDYICDNHMPTCTMSHRPCMSTNQQESEYFCKCPGRSQCEISNTTRQGQDTRLGFCVV